MNCFLCDKHFDNSELLSTYEIHIRYSHGVTSNQDLVMSLLLLDQEEFEELSKRMQDRSNQFKTLGISENKTGVKLFSNINNVKSTVDATKVISPNCEVVDDDVQNDKDYDDDIINNGDMEKDSSSASQPLSKIKIESVESLTTATSTIGASNWLQFLNNQTQMDNVKEGDKKFPCSLI